MLAGAADEEAASALPETDPCPVSGVLSTRAKSALTPEVRDEEAGQLERCLVACIGLGRRLLGRGGCGGKQDSGGRAAASPPEGDSKDDMHANVDIVSSWRQVAGCCSSARILFRRSRGSAVRPDCTSASLPLTQAMLVGRASYLQDRGPTKVQNGQGQGSSGVTAR